MSTSSKYWEIDLQCTASIQFKLKRGRIMPNITDVRRSTRMRVVILQYRLLLLMLLVLVGVVASRSTDPSWTTLQGSYLQDEKQVEKRYVHADVHFEMNPFANITVNTSQTRITNKLCCEMVTKYNVSDFTVSWIKIGNATTNLTTGNKTVTRDKRFLSEVEDRNRKWCLTIRYTEISDAGIYECQVIYNSTEYITSRYLQLELNEVAAKISSENPIKVNEGLPLRISCVLNGSRVAPDYIFWYHHDRVINYDLKGNEAVRQDSQGSELIFPRAEAKHAGNYTCVPSNALQASVTVEVDTTNVNDPPVGSGGNGTINNKQDSDDFLNMLFLLLFTSCFYR